MLSTNLLLEEEKKAIILEKSFRIIKFFGISISGTLIIGITLLSPSYLPFYFQNREFTHQLSVRQEAAKKIDEAKIIWDALQLQGAITSLRQNADNANIALDMLDLLTAQQAGIVVTDFTIQSADVTISGHAATRNDLLAFEQRLRDSSRFQDIASPLANIIQETNIKFGFKATLKAQFAL